MIDRIMPSQIPDQPGSYQFKDAEGRVIYVGKATSLRSRLASYFQPIENLHPRTASMVTVAEAVEWIVVRNEVEALILEYNLIQRFKPKFNIRMRDDKSYPFLAITTDQEWPRAGIYRGQRRRSVRYYGPYPHANSIRELLDQVLRTFPVRTCQDGKFSRHHNLGRPCLLYHIERCSGPCVGAVSKDEYTALINDLGRFLKGDTKTVLERMRREMNEAAQSLNFEKAAKIRDRLELIGRASEKQQMVGGGSFNADVFGIHQDELEAAVQVFMVRRGRVVGRKGILVDKVEEVDDSILVGQVLERHYSESGDDIPREILVPAIPAEASVIESWLSGVRRGPVTLRVAQRGEKKALAETVRLNAAAEFKRSRLMRASDHNSRAKALRALADVLGMESAPLRIECYDMSHLQGSNYVGSMVVMEDGLLKKADYRRFKVNVGQNDDFAAMYEVLRRRLSHPPIREDNTAGDVSTKRFAYPPSLIVVDGGRGQLSSANRALRDSGYPGSVTLAALAKQYEEIYVLGSSNPIRIARGSDALYLLQQLRDEAHRFAITYHRSLRSKGMTRSMLEGVRGMGSARIGRLLSEYGSVSKVRLASREELENLGWLPRSVSSALFDALHRESDTIKG